MEREKEEYVWTRKIFFRQLRRRKEKENISNEKEKEENICRRINCCGRDRWTSKALYAVHADLSKKYPKE